MTSVVGSESSDLEKLRKQYLAIQLCSDRRAALDLIDAAMTAGVSATDLRIHVIGEAQREIGALWEQDRISVAQEHAATAISQVTLAHLYHRAKSIARNGHKITLACVPGELHDFPARLLADSLDLAGYDVRFLGADVPQEDLALSVEQDPPDLLALSITMPFNAPNLRSAVERVRRSANGKVPIAVGGHACRFDSALAQQVQAQITGANDSEFLAAVKAFFSTTRAPTAKV